MSADALEAIPSYICHNAAIGAQNPLSHARQPFLSQAQAMLTPYTFVVEKTLRELYPYFGILATPPVKLAAYTLTQALPFALDASAASTKRIERMPSRGPG